MNTPNPPTDYSGKPSIPGMGPIVDMEEKKRLSKKQMHIARQAPPKDKITGADFKKLQSMKEGGDHEVAMATSSLKEIIEAAQELMSKLGGEERDIPGWIQNHITNAENYITQASQGFHELHQGEEESTSLTKLMETFKKKR